MTEVYLYKLPDITEAEAHRLTELVSADRKAKLQRLKKKENRVQSLFAELLLRAVLCKRLSIKNGELVLEREQKGKPYLAGRSDVHFSLTHTESMVAVAVSDEQVGIDAEKLKTADPRLCKRFFTADEQKLVAPETDGWLERFYFVWTRKEAYVKRSGEGLSVPLTSFSVISGKDFCYETFTVEGYTVSVCGNGQVTIVPFEKTEELLHEFLTNEGYQNQTEA